MESLTHLDPIAALSSDVIARAMELGRWDATAYSCLQGHFAAIREFLSSGLPVGVIFEDDVMIRRSLAQDLQEAAGMFQNQDLDLLRLGYLLHEHCWANENLNETRLLARSRSFVCQTSGFSTPGTQMYMINRRYASELTNHYGPGTGAAEHFLANPLSQGGYAADWLITQMGNRANIYPLLAFEEVQSARASRDDPWQEQIHLMCHEFCWDPNIHI